MVIVSIILAAIVAAAVAVGIVVAAGGPEPEPTTPPPSPTPSIRSTSGPFPTELESQLLSHIPPNLQSPPCTRATAPPPGALAAVECFTDTPQLMDYALFPDAVSMNAAYDGEVTGAGVAPGTGNCATGQPSDDTWLDAQGTENGRLLCYQDGSGGVVTWTHDELLILAEASRPGSTIRQTYRFWSQIADHA